MKSVPGADRGPRAGSPHGVVDATGSHRIARIEIASTCYPVATALGTDYITATKVGTLTPVNPREYWLRIETVTSIIRQIRLLLLGLWLGAAIFFGAAVAPAVFGVLRGAQLSNANELAGMMVQRLLAVINRGGFELSLFLLVTGYFMTKKESRLARFAEMISL